MDMLKGKTALVTGGNRGIGRGIVERFVAEGARVYAVGRSALTRPFDGKAVRYERADVARRADVGRFVAAAHGHLGRIDVLVNNAGVLIEAAIADTTDEQWDTIMNINLKGTFMVSRAVIPVMQRQGGGAIINLGSISGVFADPLAGAYCASKAGVHLLTRGIALDHGPDGIRCNAVCPGWIMTDMLAPAYPPGPVGEAVRRKVLAMHPLGRIGQPADIAAMTAWLASDDATFVTGQYFFVDGGLTARSHTDGLPPG
ncbi:MAG: SDR family NAD(P)-dependent oxidoreductase [Alphaproteobacteria bacterium]